MCRLLGVSMSGFYAWLKRPESARARRDADRADKVEAIHLRSRGTYGIPRIHAELRVEGEQVSRKWVAWLMKAKSLVGASRCIVGWAMAAHLRTERVLSALNMALWQRPPEEVVHHSDQGCQYTSLAFSRRCEEAGIRPSMGSVGDCFDNAMAAMAESFFATLECELLEQSTFRTRAEAERAIFEFIEGWYNPHRRHSSLDYLSPINFERQHARHKDGTLTPNVELSTETG